MQTTEMQIVDFRMPCAPRELVFRMFTDAEHISNWWDYEVLLQTPSRWMFVPVPCGFTA